VSKITKSARDKECTARIPNVCSGRSDTVVHCHLNGSGMGTKQNDIFGGRLCFECHNAVDGRATTEYKPETLRRWFYEAVFRTQQQLLDEGLINA
jgi:hypothetical protein